MRPRALLLVVLVAAGFDPAEAQLFAQIEPSETTLLARSGAAAGAAFTIRNPGALPLRARLRLADWRMSVDGARELLPAGETVCSLERFVRVQPAEFELGPGESREVFVSGAMPDTGPPTRYGTLIGELRLANVEGVWPAPPIPSGPGVTIYLARASAAARPAEIAGLSVRPEAESGFTVTVRVWNGGDRPLEAAGEVVVRDSTGSERARGRLPRGVVLPRSIRALAWTCEQPLPAGRHRVAATIRSEGREAAATSEVRWPMGRPLVFQQPVPAP